MSDGLALLLQPEPIFYLVAGLTIGFVVGALPGFDSANGAALLLPFSIGLTPESALILLSAVYAGSSMAGAIPAILLNVPGTSGAAATALDGYPLSRQGRGGFAIGIARVSSSIGGVIGAGIVLVVLEPISRLALQIRSPEMFLLAVLGLLIIGSVSGGSIGKGVLAGFVGMLIASMGASPETGHERLTFGIPQLFESVPFIPVIIGTLGIGQVLYYLSELDSNDKQTVVGDEQTGIIGVLHSFVSDTKDTIEGGLYSIRRIGQVARGSIIGVMTGAIPGLGPAVANFISYGIARRASSSPETFGHGNPDGVIASESCDNATAAGTLVPTLALGIPGSAVAAVMLSALYLQGIVPGPRVLVTHRAEAYAVILAVLTASVLLLPLSILLAAPLVSLTRVRPSTLVPLIFVMSFAGAYASRNSMFDVGLMAIFAIIGFVMRRSGYPPVPLVLGMILGPIAEENLARSLLLSRYSFGIFWASWPARILLAMIVYMLAWTVAQESRTRRNARPRRPQA